MKSQPKPTAAQLQALVDNTLETYMTYNAQLCQRCGLYVTARLDGVCKQCQKGEKKS